jgi:hypothetical protein
MRRSDTPVGLRTPSVGPPNLLLHRVQGRAIAYWDHPWGPILEPDPVARGRAMPATALRPQIIS